MIARPLLALALVTLLADQLGGGMGAPELNLSYLPGAKLPPPAWAVVLKPGTKPQPAPACATARGKTAPAGGCR